MLDDYASDMLLEMKSHGPSRYRELSRIVQNPKTLSRKLKLLSSLGLVNRLDRSYSLTEAGERAAKMVEEWRELSHGAQTEPMNLACIPHPTFGPVLGRYCRILQQHFGERLLGVLLFGSIARGDWTKESDIDLLVVVDLWDTKTWTRSNELLALRTTLRKTREYSDSVGAGFVPIIQHYPLGSEEASLNHRIYPDIVLDGIIIYEKDGFITQLIGNLRESLQQKGARRVINETGASQWEMEPAKNVEDSS